MFWNSLLGLTLRSGFYFIYSFRQWKVIVDKKPEKVYYINVCASVAHGNCKEDSSVCSTSLDDTSNSRENLGSLSKRVFKTTIGAAGFSIEYTGGSCRGRGSDDKTWSTNIFMRCGRFLVSVVARGHVHES